VAALAGGTLDESYPIVDDHTAEYVAIGCSQRPDIEENETA
jgi:hypothetical protein